MWKLVWKGDSRAQTLLLTIHHNEGWEPVVDWWLPRMPSNVTQKQVAGLLRQGSVKVVFYLFSSVSTFYQRIYQFWQLIQHICPSPPPQKKKLECISFIHMTVESKLFFSLLLGILKINPIYRCWHDICSFGIPKNNLKTHDDKSLFFKDLLGKSFLLNNHISTS